MSPSPPSSSPRVGRAEWGLGVVVLLVALGVAWFYHWTVTSARADLSLNGQKRDYYNLLVDGFADGHLYMKAEPDPRLLALPPAERPGSAPFMLDASLYKDRYYLYFGVSPVMTSYLPYAVLTGHDLPEAWAAVLFMLAGFGLASAWWWEARRQFFPQLGGVWVVLGVVALGLCTTAPSALRRPMFYEVAIGAGYAFSMLALWAATRAWLRPRQRFWWLVLAGVAVGLAVGSRANLAPAGLLLLLAAAAGLAWRGAVPGARARLFALALLAAGGGAGAVGAGLAGYNYARFGSVTEFGHNHQLGTNPTQMFRGENLRYNLSLYYLKPPALNGYFPFVAPAEEGLKPKDYVGREHVHGQWPWTLVAAVAAGCALALWGRRGGEWGGVWALAVLVFGVNLVVVGLTGVRSNRYMLDFHPALVLATLVPLGVALAQRGRWSRALGVVVALLVPAAALFNVLGSLQVHGFFASTSPAVYARMAARADGWVWPWLRGEQAGVGGREVELRWPSGNRGLRREPFFAAGTKDFRDFIFVEFDGEGRVRFVFQHGEFGELTGDWFPFVAGAAAQVRVDGGPLLPGVAHPWYGNRTADERLALKRRLQIRVGGELRFDRDAVSYDSSPRLQEWGEWRRSDGKIAMFSGQIERVAIRPADDQGLRARATARGAIRLKLGLPSDRFGWTEPLLAQGGAAGFDVLAVTYVRPGVVQLLHDQLGGGGRRSEEFAADYSQPQRVEIRLPTASDDGIWAAVDGKETEPSAEKLSVRWNGREVFRPDLAPLTAGPLSMTFGANWWNASGMGSFFAGRLQELPRSEALGEVRAGALIGRLSSADTWAGERGVWLRLERADGKAAALVWRREAAAGSVRIGLVEDAGVNWLAWVAPEDLGALRARFLIPKMSDAEKTPAPTWLEAEVRGKAVFVLRTEFFDGQAIKAWGLVPKDWSGSAVGRADPADAEPSLQLPGRLGVRFKFPAGGLLGSDPLLSVGKAGAADSIFIRGLGKGRYILGLDHWGWNAVESAPVTLDEEQVHTLVIELSSLGAEGELPRDRARLVLNGQTVLDAPQALYRVEPREIVFGANPHGMSTSNAVFRGEIVSVRAKVSPEETR